MPNRTKCILLVSLMSQIRLLARRALHPLRAPLSTLTITFFIWLLLWSLLASGANTSTAQREARAGTSAFWQAVRDEVNVPVEVPLQRWDVDRYFSPDVTTKLEMYVRFGGFVEDLDAFDSGLFR
jgi:Beta-ketoacyl synthase, N-terminal domain